VGRRTWSDGARGRGDGTWLRSLKNQFFRRLLACFRLDDGKITRRKKVWRTRITLVLVWLAQSWLIEAANAEAPFSFEAGVDEGPNRWPGIQAGGAHLSSE